MLNHQVTPSLDSNESAICLSPTFVKPGVRPTDLPFALLAKHCRQETADFFNGRGVEGIYCLEAFRRAIVGRSDVAWEFLIELYYAEILGWLKRRNRLAKIAEDPDALVNEVFAKFAHAVGPEKFASFANLKVVLHYLRLCADSVILDYLRRAQRIDLDLDSSLPNHAAPLDGDILWNELLELIVARLKDEDEQLIFQAMFVYGMKPLEIRAQWPDRFPTIQSINQKRQNIVDRLKCDESLLRYYRGN
jgi:DNA-directed RNA polymerase specialized sigma24 family protein